MQASEQALQSTPAAEPGRAEQTLQRREWGAEDTDWAYSFDDEEEEEDAEGALAPAVGRDDPGAAACSC